MRVKPLVVSFFVVVLSACSVVPMKEFDASTRGHIKTIAVVQLPTVNTYSVKYLRSGSSALGEVGRVSKNIDINTMTDQIAIKLKQNGDPDIGGLITTDLIRELKNVGYEVITIKPAISESSTNTDKQPTYSFSTSGADAVLEVKLTSIGFWATSIFSDYQPSIRALATLTSVKDNTLLYREDLKYCVGYKNPTITKLECDPKYSYKDFKTLNENVPQATEGLKIGAANIVKHIVSVLR